MCLEQDIPFLTTSLTKITKESLPFLKFLCFSLWEIFKLATLFSKGNYNLIYACGGSWQFKGAIAGKLAGISVLWHLNDTYMPFLIRKVFGNLSCLACGYVYASERTKTYYAPYVSPNKFEFTIPAPVDTMRFDPELKLMPDELFPELRGKFVIGTGANINPIKGFETFIKSALEIQKKFIQLHLL